MRMWKITCWILSVGILIGMSYFIIMIVHDRCYRMNLARMCVEQDPATAAWVFDMARGRVLSLGHSAVFEDDVEGSTCTEWFTLEVGKDDAKILTNKYLVSHVARDNEGIVVSNFNSCARTTVETLWKKVR